MKKLVKIVLFFFLVASMHGVCDAKEWESIRRAEKIADAVDKSFGHGGAYSFNVSLLDLNLINFLSHQKQFLIHHF